MKGNIEERACELAVYIIENRTTVREAAKRFGNGCDKIEEMTAAQAGAAVISFSAKQRLIKSL